MARKPKFVPAPEWGDRMGWPRVNVLAFDPSMSSTGWAFVGFWPNRRPVLNAYGILSTEPEEGTLNQEQVIRRSGEIFDQTQNLVQLHCGVIHHYAIEVPVPGSFGVASQSGAIMAAVVHAAIRGTVEVPRVSFQAPTRVKRVAALDGRATKAAVKKKAFEWLGIDPFRVRTDVTDAIAVAITAAIGMEIGVPDDY